MSNKTITIQQGTGDEALEMNVQVTQEELDKMEEIRSKDPSAWEGRGLDLVKAAKDAVVEASEENAQPKKCTNWKLILGIILGVLAIIGTIIFAEKSRNKEQEVSQKQEINNAGVIEQWIGSECVEVNRRRIYETLKEKNKSAVPESFNVFSKAMDNQSYRDWAYEEVLQQKLKIGTKEDFELAMTKPNSDIFRCIFEIASYYGMPDSEEDMVSYLKESEENRKKFYYKLLEVGMPEGFDEFSTLLNFSQNNRQQVSEDNMREVYNRLSELGSKGSYEEFVEFFEESEGNKKKVYEKLKDNGYPGTYKDFVEYIGYKKEDIYYENIGKVYQDAVDRGFKDDEVSFREFLASSKENRHRLFLKMKEVGMKANEREFLIYIGYEKDLLEEIDWQSVLDDFVATKEAKPNLTEEEWFEKFPEFNNDRNLLQAAFDYDATVKSGKYSDENELRSKFPEFWPDYLTNTRTNQNVNDLYKGLCDNNLYNGSIEDFKSSLKCEPYRDALYHFLFEKEIYEGTYDGFHEEIGMSTTTNSTTANHRRVLYDILSLYDYDLGDYETFSQKMNDEKKRRIFYDAVSEEYDIGSWEEFSAKVVDSPKNNGYSVVSSQLTTFSSKQYSFTYQYDDNAFKLVEKTNKNSHCVMKLQSPVDEVKSTLVSVWENPEFSSSYDTDFISSCQSVDEGMGKVISSAVKTKVDGVNALKSELIISPMGKQYYAAIYRIIHKKRMYMLNIYIPVEEYNKDKLYGDKCANNFKFN